MSSTLINILLATQNQHKLLEFKEFFDDFSKDSNLEINLFSAADFTSTSELDPEETGSSFAENAAIKARAFARAYHHQPSTTQRIDAVLADDSGICVSALDNFPAIYSARWLAGDDSERCLGLQNLLNYFLQDQLSSRNLDLPLPPINLPDWTTAIPLIYKNTPSSSLGRMANFTVALCYYKLASDQEFIFTGQCWGKIAQIDLTKQADPDAFGYDPIFVPDLRQLPELKAHKYQSDLSFSELPAMVKSKISHRADAIKKLKIFLMKGG